MESLKVHWKNRLCHQAVSWQSMWKESCLPAPGLLEGSLNWGFHATVWKRDPAATLESLNNWLTPFVTSGCRTRSAFSDFLPVYFQVTSSMVRLLSLGKRFFSQAQQWTCWSVGEIMKKLEDKNQNQETIKLDSHRMIQFILCPQTTGAIQQLPR